MGFDVNEFDLPLFEYPWGGFRLNYQGGKSAEDSRFCGPSTEKLIQDEYESTVSLYNDVRDSGYKFFRKRAVIGGTFLIDRSGNKRFVVLQGNHRMSVLSAIGYNNVLVYTMSGYQEYISESSIDRWSLVRERRCPQLKALRLFSAFFNGQGNVPY
ncbi:hypothetical protein OAU68_00760 [Litorivicinus sp.]|nr:hypothetical protein [Litorivicinus sp.]